MTPQDADRELVLRHARMEDAALLARWDEEPHVIAATTDDINAPKAFGDAYWPDELAMQSDVYRYYIAELDGRPIGAMLIIDPHLEPTHYWGEVGPDLRAVDIWIGEADCLGRGYGTRMMSLALDICFADPRVNAVLIDPLASNVRAHRFYQRIGFEPIERRLMTGEDDCLIHSITREAWRARSLTPQQSKVTQP
jgi:aminoglycoside 6'-N-acetyltransferase